MQKQTLLTIGFITLSSLALAQPSSPSLDQLKGITPQKAMQLANAWKGTAVKSFVTDSAVQFTFPDGRQESVPLPTKQMVIAIAPYVNQTHPCKTHFMSGCQGELVNTPVKVQVTNAAGKTVINRTVKTLPNGFLELWLDRNQTYNVMLSAQGRSVKGQLQTLKGSDTCVTTLRLQ
ncbi:CueP family metal-binding protein [Deinococcus fonticola]|uniref:CueP family metal-binding protein n=1 Tax=Deinococcus fonticola TaxID=2528713 RepID=UPI001075349E|nr:CueP family metal-binding protein [Deinococcus fonticola]